MADAINRVVPPSVSLDRAAALGREREGKNTRDEQKRAAEEATESLTPAGSALPDDEITPLDTNKGKNIDIKA